MFKIVAIHMFAFLLALEAEAVDYDVDMPPSNDPKVQIIRVNVGGCDTIFKVPTDKLEEFNKNLKSAEKARMIGEAFKHYQSGCR